MHEVVAQFSESIEKSTIIRTEQTPAQSTEEIDMLAHCHGGHRLPARDGRHSRRPLVAGCRQYGGGAGLQQGLHLLVCFREDTVP